MNTKPYWAAIGLLSVIVACDKHAGTPTSPTPPTPTNPNSVTVSSLEVRGPGTMAPGQSAQFTVIAHMSDSSTMEPTGVQWIASPPGMLQVDQTGLATAAGIGGAAVTAEIRVGPGITGFVRGSHGVVVVPEGTFLMVGVVADADFSSAPLADALVEVTPGGLSATTDSEGFYRIYGATTGAEARVTRRGYDTLVQTIGLTAQGRQDFRLTASGPRLSVSGSYTLAIDAGDWCSQLPADLQHRRYDAVATQIGLMVYVTLTEPRFQLTNGLGNHFSGRIDGSTVTFTLAPFVPGWDWNVAPAYPDVAERLSNTSLLVVDGTAVGTGSTDAVFGTLDGSLSNMDPAFPDWPYQPASCSGKHRFSLTRR